MRKMIFIAMAILGTTMINAQVEILAKPIIDGVLGKLDVGMGGQVEQLKKLNSKIEKLNSTAWENKLDNYENRRLAEESNLREVEIENTYWKVDPYVRNGMEMNSILMKEKTILKSIKDLRNFGNNSNYNDRNSINTITSDILKNVGYYVDTAVGIVTDDKYRMSNEDRRKYLQEIEKGLDAYNYVIQRQKSSYQAQQKLNENVKRQKNSFENAINHQNNVQRQLINSRRK